MKKLFLFSILLSVAFLAITAPRMLRLDSPDFKVFHVAAKHALYEPENLYKVSPDRYLYPPSTALLLAPFGFSDHWRIHQWTWHFFIGVSLFFLASRSWFLFFAVLCLNRYFAINFGYGQINPILLVLVFLTTFSLQAGKRLACFTWPLASILKVYPLVQGLEFVFRRRWRELGISIGVFLALLAFPLLVWSPQLFWDLHLQFYQALQSKGLPTDSGNQSILGLFVRFFVAQPFQLHPIGEVTWALADIPKQFLQIFSFLIGASFTFISWKKAFARNSPLDAASAMGFSLLFLSHIVWKDYFIFLVFPLAQLIEQKPKNWKVVLGTYLALVYLSSPEILTHHWSARLDSISVHLWAAIWLWMYWLRMPDARKLS